MPLFKKAQQFVVTGGNFRDESTTNVQNINSNRPSGIDILLEASYPDAAFDSSARDSPPRCWPGTRVECIKFITGWSGLSWMDQPPPMLWINGPAGVGKSAVAQTCAEKLKPMGRLGAAFFFSTLDERDDHSRFFPTIVYQLCAAFPDYHDLVDRKLSRDKTLVDKMMVQQFKELIVEPLQELEKCGKGIGKRTIIVDGLDECANPNAQREIIEIIVDSVRERTTPLCWAFFSRPEPNIRATFIKTSITPLFQQWNLLISREVDTQIERYLRGAFQILRNYSSPGNTLPMWPSDDEIRTLVAASGGLFIYAATILNFVGQADSSLGPDGLLKEVLTLIRGDLNAGVSSDQPFARLDAFYRRIMERVPPKALPSFQLLLCSVLFYLSGSYIDTVDHSAHSAMLLANMLQLSEFDFRVLCSKFHAVIWISNQPQLPALEESIDDTRSFYESKLPPRTLNELLLLVQNDLGGIVRFHHRSFAEFLKDQSRSRKFCIEASTMYNYVVKHYAQQQLRYKESYLLSDTGPMLAPGFPNSATPLSWAYSNELINSLLKAYTYRRAALIVGKGFRDLGESDLESDTRRQISCVEDQVSQFWFRNYIFPGCLSHLKCMDAPAMAKIVPGVNILRVPPSAFNKFNVSKFKKVVATSREYRCYRPYSPPLGFRCWAFLRATVSSAEWGLHVDVQGTHRLFWYWELNLKKRYYQEFQSTNLIKGQEVFQEQILLWSADDHVDRSHKYRMAIRRLHRVFWQVWKGILLFFIASISLSLNGFGVRTT